MAFSNSLALRTSQAVLAIIIVGLTAWIAHAWNSRWSPSSNDFLLFISIWTLLALVYLYMAHGRYDTAGHRFGILIAEGLTTIFWFAGFIAVAVFLGRGPCGEGWGPCRATTAAVVLAAIEWLLFMVTMASSIFVIRKNRGVVNPKHTPAVNTENVVV